MCLCPQIGFGSSVCVCGRMPLLVGSFVVNMSAVASMSLAASDWVAHGRLLSGRLQSMMSATACCQHSLDGFSPLESELWTYT
jgi:hypothetical protein